MAPADAALFERFEALLELPPGDRATALAALDLDADTRVELEALLAADARGDTRLERAVEGGAQRLSAMPAGLRLGPWKVLREIGAGGMGTVFLGERADGAFAQQVAIKVLRGFPTEDGMRRLRQERQVLAQLDHPYIARLIDGGETPEGQPYFVMEFVEGEPLTTFAATHRLGVAGRLRLLDRVAEAVGHAHQRLVIHRDLKPANVLVRSDGTPKLLDFGVAKLVDVAQDGQRETSTRVWSEGFASPEQVDGRTITTATDIYALGVLLRYLLDAVPTDPELRGMVALATAQRPQDRYPSVNSLREDIANYLAARPLRAAPDTAWYRARKFVARHRLGAAVCLLALIGATLFVIGLDRALREARHARDLAQAAQRESETQRRIAQRVGDFMTDMFSRANSATTEGKVLTARDVIATAGEELLRDETLDASSRAVLLERLSATLIGLRDAEGARVLIEHAQRDRASLAPAQAALLDYTQARVLARLERRGEADTLNRRALAALELDRSNLSLRARALQQAMWLANGRADFDRTLALAPGALEAWANDPDPDPSDRAAILNTRFIAEHALGRNEEMLQSLRSAWADIRQAQGRGAAHRAHVGANLAISLIDLGQVDEASVVLDELEPFVREVFAIDSRSVLVRMLRIRAEWWLASGQPRRALDVVEEARAIQRGLVPSQQQTDTLGVTTASSLLALDRWQAAIAAADAVAEGGLPPAKAGLDSSIARAYAARAIAHCRLGRPAAAIADGAAATIIVADLPPTQIERLVIERQLRTLDLRCRSV